MHSKLTSLLLFICEIFHLFCRKCCALYVSYTVNYVYSWWKDIFASMPWWCSFSSRKKRSQICLILKVRNAFTSFYILPYIILHSLLQLINKILGYFLEALCASHPLLIGPPFLSFIGITKHCLTEFNVCFSF